MKIKHEGKSAHRISRNPAEAVFAAEWAKENERNTLNRGCGTLDWLLHGDGAECWPEKTTKAEAVVAATVVQWLGSPVGMSWVKRTLAKAERAER